MHGALGTAMSKRRLKVNRKVIPDPLDDYRGPTPERLRHAGGAVEVGRDQRGIPTGIRTMRDAPIERALARGAISQVQYDAAVRYRRNWYQSGLAGSLQSIDPNRVYASDCTSYGHFARSEAQQHFRDERYAAVKCVGLLSAAILDEVVCCEVSLKKLGEKFGWKSGARGIEAVEKLVSDSLDRLAKLWGME
jgi:hypothetical protein